MHRQDLGARAIAVVILAAGSAAVGHAQPASPPPEELSSSVCPTPVLSQTFVHINVVPNGDACKLDPPAGIENHHLKVYVGDPVEWTFCSLCNVETRVILERKPGWPPGPFSHFQQFNPPPDSAQKVTIKKLKFGQTKAALGRSAFDPDVWDYSITLTTETGTPLPPSIDPRIEIDDSGFQQWPWRAILVAILTGLGLFAGYRFGVYRTRRKLSQ